MRPGFTAGLLGYWFALRKKYQLPAVPLVARSERERGLTLVDDSGNSKVWNLLNGTDSAVDARADWLSEVPELWRALAQTESARRGLERMDTPILKGTQVYQNFIKTHKGQRRTPAETARVQAVGKDRWKTLIQNASRNR